MLKEPKLTPFTTKEITPTGWTRRQLEIQAAGLSGNLHKIWPDVRDSRWVGGDKEGWERVPYWLDGFIPLAFLLDDIDMQATAKRYIDAILDGQQADGWICPCEQKERRHYDVWALFLILKVLVLYHDCTGDERIEEAVYRAFKQYKGHLAFNTLFGWAQARWYEALIPLLWIYERRPEPWLLELAHILAVEGLDYKKLYHVLPMGKPDEHPHWTFPTHIVNTAMALKASALYSLLGGCDPEEGARTILNVLDKNHSTAVGHFTGDECLAGDGPIQGTELCGVVEAMYSYEHLLAVTGNPYWGDRLELLAFNALPATISPDMWTHQYDQMTNQPECRVIPEDRVHFTSNGGESHLFGLEPNFGCCTANFNQGWPKLLLSAFMQSKQGIAVNLLIPAKLSAHIGGVPVTIETVSEYPFKRRVRLMIKAARPVTFELMVRIPGFEGTATLDESPVEMGAYAHISREWMEQTVEIELCPTPMFIERPNGLKAVRCGAIVFALPIKTEWIRREYTNNGVERVFPYCDYELNPLEDWGYGFSGGLSEPDEHMLGDTPFSPTHPPLSMTVDMAPVQWKSENGICALVPEGTKPVGDTVKKRLIPYGCTDLRMTEMPMFG